MFISRLLSLAINIVTVHEEKKHGIIPRISVCSIIPWKLWYNTKKIMVLSLDLASLIIKLLVSGMAIHSHKSVWSWCAMCSHI